MEHFAAFDLETTGTDTKTARPVEVGVYLSDGPFMGSMRCNPGEVIFTEAAEEASAVHGIKAEDLEDAPPVEEAIAWALRRIGDLPLLTYNGAAFDLKITPEIGKGRPVIDVFRLVQLLQADHPIPELGSFGHPLGLAAFSLRLEVVYGAATGRVLEGAHNAGRDAQATAEVFNCLRCLYPRLLGRPLVELAEALEEPPSTWSDWSRTCEYKHGHWRMGIGKHKGMRLDRVPRDYIRWMLREDFASSTKDLVRGFLDR